MSLGNGQVRLQVGRDLFHHGHHPRVLAPAAVLAALDDYETVGDMQGIELLPHGDVALARSVEFTFDEEHRRRLDAGQGI